MTLEYETFQAFRKILCICPCCNELIRVSDLHLKTKEKTDKTWLDGFEEDHRKLQIKAEKFGGKEAELRAKSVAAGRKEAELLVNEQIASKFKKLKLDIFDIKPILHPIDFVVFKGMNKLEEINEVLLLSKSYTCPTISPLRKQIKDVIKRKNFDWSVARISAEGEIVMER